MATRHLGKRVLMTRDHDVFVELEDRAKFANRNSADLFVSIHVNWIPRAEVRPLETYYAGPSDDPHALSLARAENHESGYPLAAYRQLLEKVYLDARRDESALLARAVNAELYRSLRAVNPALEDRGVKRAPFAVLLGARLTAPAERHLRDGGALVRREVLDLDAVAIVDERLEDLDVAPRDDGTLHAADELLGLPREHHAGDHLDPSGAGAVEHGG